MSSVKPLYNDISNEEKKKFQRDLFNETSYVQNFFKKDNLNLGNGVEKYSSQLREYFTRTIKKRLGINFPELEKIHENVDPLLTKYDYDYGINKLTEALYDMDDEFVRIYHEFVRDWVVKNVADGRKFYFQHTPTIRVHCPAGGLEGVYPAYHNDIFLGHHPCEVNIWIPFTEIGTDNHGFTIMSVAESKEILSQYDFDIPAYYKEVRDHSSNAFRITDGKAKPVTTNFGEVLVFDVRSMHSTMPMKTQTRVSMDVRIIFVDEKAAHPYNHQGLGRMKTPFEPGQYYFKEAFGG